MTIAGIQARRDAAIRDAQEEAWQARQRILADMQAKIDAARRQYDADMARHLASLTSPERRAA